MTNESTYPPPYSPPVKKPSTFVKILPWILLPVAFFLGVGAGASGNESSEEPKEEPSEAATTPAEIQAQEAEEEPEGAQDEEDFLLLLDTVATSATINTEEEPEALILLGRKVCFWFDEGDSYESVIIQLLAEADSFGLDNTGVGEVAGAAVSTLCTEYLAEVTS